MARKTLPLLLALAFLAGCQSLGPAQLSHDRSAYGEAIAVSWREQMLLNVVKLRSITTRRFISTSHR